MNEARESTILMWDQSVGCGVAIEDLEKSP
jgi:hypothetical protein